eukprot:1512198-Amphidinium_carterae.1
MGIESPTLVDGASGEPFKDAWPPPQDRTICGTSSVCPSVFCKEKCIRSLASREGFGHCDILPFHCLQPCRISGNCRTVAYAVLQRMTSLQPLMLCSTPLQDDTHPAFHNLLSVRQK